MNSELLSSDTALTDPIDDRLGYAPFAKHLAKSVLRGCPADGFVVGLFGPWGSGKSTVLNFILHYLEIEPGERHFIVRFNPWWFSGRDDLVRRFFVQFEAACLKNKSHLKGLIKALGDYGDALEPIPHVGKWGWLLAKWARAARNKDVQALKLELTQALAKDARRILVVIDDIDRLSSDEIPQIFQLIKAVGDLPNVTYLLAFDRTVVAAALERVQAGGGDQFIEKIIQAPFTLPTADSVQLQGMLFERLNAIFGDDQRPEFFNDQDWWKMYFDGVRPFIKKPRDAVRLTNALSVTYPPVRGEVNLVDFVGLEVLRVFAPMAFETICNNQDRFIETPLSRHTDQDEERAFHANWLEHLRGNREATEHIVRLLFPRMSANRRTDSRGERSAAWRRQLRICSPEIFPVYFRLSIPEDEVSAAMVRAAIEATASQKALGELLLALAKKRRNDGFTKATSLLSRLLDHADDIPEANARFVIAAVLEVADSLVSQGKSDAGLLDIPDDIRITWLIRAMLRRVPESERGGVLVGLVDAGGLYTTTRVLFYLANQHGLWGGKPEPEADRILPAADISSLEGRLSQRLEASARDGTIWAHPKPLVLLSALINLGKADATRECVSRRTNTRDELINFLGGFMGKVFAQPVAARSGRTVSTIDPNHLTDYFDLSTLTARVEGLLAEKDLVSKGKAVLEAYLRGKRSRDAGRDPVMDSLESDR